MVHPQKMANSMDFVVHITAAQVTKGKRNARLQLPKTNNALAGSLAVVKAKAKAVAGDEEEEEDAVVGRNPTYLRYTINSQPP